ncbi:hypothetical protein [Brachybacterium sacelli]
MDRSHRNLLLTDGPLPSRTGSGRESLSAGRGGSPADPDTPPPIAN